MKAGVNLNKEEVIWALPSSLGKLSKLKFLDISHNKLETLPPELAKLGELQTLNAHVNQLTDMPDVSAMKSLHVLNISHNKLAALPDGLCDESLVHLSLVNANNNEIRTLPAQLSSLPHLNALHLANNKIEELPNELCECPKLKELTLSGNKLKDRKLARFAEQNSMKQIMTYLAAALQKEAAASGEKKDKKAKPKKKKKAAKDDDVEEVIKNLVSVLRFPDDGLVVKVETKPLFKSKEVSADVLFKELREEADALRKEKKRSTVSGIHKYLDLLKDKEEFPCLLDAEGHVISFPPITNSDKTKISKETRSVLVEVTSSVSLDICKKVMDTLLKETLQTGVGSGVAGGGGEDEEEGADSAAKGGDGDGGRASTGERLVVQQVKILDEEGGLKVVYPSRTDLLDDGFVVDRK
nr:hypothetical protein BaRGS_005656 [Batillaria attramentaria]